MIYLQREKYLIVKSQNFTLISNINNTKIVHWYVLVSIYTDINCRNDDKTLPSSNKNNLWKQEQKEVPYAYHLIQVRQIFCMHFFTTALEVLTLTILNKQYNLWSIIVMQYLPTWAESEFKWRIRRHVFCTACSEILKTLLDKYIVAYLTFWSSLH